MINNTLVLRTDTTDPWWNLAVEEYLLDNIKPNQCILYLWQNQNTVVIGKHQNPWKECRTQLLEEEGGKLARGLSGGGAVFHDVGNLNFTFIVDKQYYDLKRQVAVILAAVKSLGIDAVMSGRNDLTADNRKFSGNAFCFRKHGAFHHGTVLINADFTKLARYLQVSDEKIRSKGVASVRSRVVNLAEFKPNLSVDEAAEALIAAFSQQYGIPEAIKYNTDYMDQGVLKALYNKYASWSWRYGEAPEFDINLSTRFIWGGIEIVLKLNGGKVEQAQVFSDALYEEYIGLLPTVLTGSIFSLEILAQKITEAAYSIETQQLAEDISLWLKSLNI